MAERHLARTGPRVSPRNPGGRNSPEKLAALERRLQALAFGPGAYIVGE